MENRQYFEGILQLRNTDKELVDFVKKDICKNKEVWVAKQIKSKNGVDLYLSSQKYLVNLGKKLQKRFKGELKISRKLYSQSRLTGKKIYRVTVLFRAHKFKIGDIVEYRGEDIKIKSLGNRMGGCDLKTGKRIRFDYKEIKNNLERLRRQVEKL